MRTNFFYAVIGAPRTGKSTFLKSFCKKYIQKTSKKCFWFTHSESESVDFAKKISTTKYETKTLTDLLKSLKNCLIVIDDYQIGNLCQSDGKIIRDLAGVRGHNNIDLCIVSHSVNGLPPKIPNLIEFFTFFRPTEFVFEKAKKPLIFENSTVLEKFKALKKCDFTKEILTENKHFFTIKAI